LASVQQREHVNSCEVEGLGASAPSAIVELREVSKTFGAVTALERASIEILPAEIVGLVGDNGAGKSTLIKIISGVTSIDSGLLMIDGRHVTGWDVRQARAAGIETVYQDKALVLNQSISVNIFMGRELKNRFGLINIGRQRAETDRLMRWLGFTSRVFSPESLVGTLSGGEREGVAIARAIYFKARLLILDEPTTALSLAEAEKVFGFVRAAKADGTAVLFISHNMYHAYDLADRLVVLDRGRVVEEVDKDLTSVGQLVIDLQEIVRTGAITESPKKSLHPGSHDGASKQPNPPKC
jgi:simple sugar transport system ATP-binding protein